MSRPALAAVAVLLLAGPALAAGPEVNAPRPTARTADTVSELEQVVRALAAPFVSKNTGACGQNLPRLIAAGANPLFDRLAVETRSLILDIAVACSLREATPEAATLIRRLEPLATAPGDVADVNQVLLADSRKRRDFAEAARRLIKVIDADPVRVGRWWPPYLDPIVNGEGVVADTALSVALLKRLTTLSWTDEDSQVAARERWAHRYADALADQGDTVGAERALATMESTDLWIAVAQDGRYAVLWPRFQAAGRFDWRRRVEAELVRKTEAAAARPGQLAGILDQLQLLRQLQRYAEAIKLGQSYRNRIKAGEAFTDSERYGNWVLNELGYILLDTGNAAEAEAVFLESIEIGEQGSMSVSQRINWASMLNALGRPSEALAILETVSAALASPYGEMWTDAAKVCALTQTGGAGVPALLASMRERWNDNSAALMDALICVGRSDEAAELYVRRLRSPQHREAALQAFQVVLPPPALTPRQIELERRRQAIVARPEVQAALAAVGRAIDLPLAGRYWGSI